MMGMNFKYFGKIENLIFVMLFTTLLGLALNAHTISYNLDLRIASSGFSILEVLQAHENPLGFARDYPGGARLTTAASPTAYLYFLGQTLGFNWLAMNYVMIFLEICTLLAGAWLFWNALFFTSNDGISFPRQIIKFGFIWAAFFLLISSAQRVNLANFNFPFFHGQFYGFADGLRLTVLAMIIRHRWISAATIFFICFAIHPIKAVMAVGFAAPLALYDWRSLLNLRFVVAATFGGAACIGWYIFTLSPTDSVPITDFVAYTRTFQSHWYPFDLGVFGERNSRGITPFMALVLTTVVSLSQKGWGCALREKLQFGIVGLLILTAFGLFISVDQSSAILIRISFVRASTLITLLAPLFIVAGAIYAWREQKWAMAAGLLAFMWTSLTTTMGTTFLPPTFALGLTALHFFHSRKIDYLLLVTAICVAIGLILLTINYSDVAGPIYSILPALKATVALWVLFRIVDILKKVGRGIPIAALAISIACVYGGWQFSNQKSRYGQRNMEVSRAYKETQLWAHDNTPKTALFMVDPCRWYGWRDFSGRASIGTVREWYMTAWIYLDRRELLERGKEIAKTLGFDMEPFRNSPSSNGAICKAARAAYYDPAFLGAKQIADRYGVNFFVFEEKFAKNLPSMLRKRAKFQNEHFFVLAAKDLIK